MYKIKNSIITTEKKTYATDDSYANKTSIDCSDGINNLLVCEKAQTALNNISMEMITDYPHSTELKNLILENSGNDNISKSSIFLGNGSMPILCNLNKLFLYKGSKVLGYAPQYSAYESDVCMFGAAYDYMLLKKADNYKFNTDEFLNKITGEHNLIFIDNPNNPTGQIINIEDIERIIDKASKFNTCVIVDEAYGDYMPKENSAVNLIGKHDNFFVLKTFSKGWGIAGIRAGYMITSNSLAKYYTKIHSIYDMSSIGRHVACEALKDKCFLNEVIAKTKAIKSKIKNLKLNNISIAQTSNNVSIMMLTHESELVDLAKEFEKRGIKVVSGTNLRGAGTNSVRFRIPSEKDLSKTIDVLKEIDDLN